MKRWLLFIVTAFLSTGLQAQKSHLLQQGQDSRQYPQNMQMQSSPQHQMVNPGINQARIQKLNHRDISQAPLYNPSAIKVNDSINEFGWNAAGNAWKTAASYRELYSYDKQGRKIGELASKRTISGKWRNIYRTSSFYNINSDLIVWVEDDWDTIANAWVPYERDTMSYNSKHQVLTEKWYFYNTISKKFFLGQYFKYNDAGFELDYYSFAWNPKTFALTGGIRVTSTPTAKNVPLEEINTVYNIATGKWDNFSKYAYTYFRDTLVATRLESDWVAAAWQNSRRTTNTYNSTSGLQQQELNETYEVATSKWINEDRTSYTYQNNLVSVELLEIWDNDLKVWKNDQRTTYTYQNTHPAVVLIEMWDSDLAAWANSSRITYSYFTNNKVKDILMQLWVTDWVDMSKTIFNSQGLWIEYWVKYTDFISGTVKSGIRVLFEYDQTSLLLSIIHQDWNTQTVDWLNKWKDVYYYSVLTEINNQYPDAIACFFQNPYLSGSEIKCSMMKTGGIYELSLYSLTGSCVYRRQISGNEPFIIDKFLPDGMYMLTINSKNERIYAKKLIIQNP